MTDPAISADMATSLQRLIDRQQIQDLVLAYSRAVDRRDFDLLKTLYHEDATDDHGGLFCGPAADYVAWLPGAMAAAPITQHFVGNMLITIDGDRGEGEIYCQAYHLLETPDGPVDLITAGRYLDKYEKRDGVWRFAHRKIVQDWTHTGPSTCDLNSPFTPGVPSGGHFPEDPSYALRPSLPRS